MSFTLGFQIRDIAGQLPLLLWRATKLRQSNIRYNHSITTTWALWSIMVYMGVGIVQYYMEGVSGALFQERDFLVNVHIYHKALYIRITPSNAIFP
jgi:hypothetical protein